MVFYLYHYTNSVAADLIENDRVINVTPAGSKFAWFGQGVYLTSMPPSSGRKAILWNNHRKKTTKDPNLWKKTSVFFRLSAFYLTGFEKCPIKDGRDVYIYRHAINLNFPYKRGTTDECQALGSPGIDSVGGRGGHSQPVSNSPSTVNIVNNHWYSNVGKTIRRKRRYRRRAAQDHDGDRNRLASEDENQNRVDDCCIIL